MTIKQIVKYCKTNQTIYSGNCRACGNVFFSTGSMVKAQYCNLKCRGFVKRTGNFSKCALQECSKQVYRKGSHIGRHKNVYCSDNHYYQHRRETNDMFNTKSKRMDKYGYKQVSIKGKPMKEHRYLFEQLLGRKLKPFENIHHKNGIRMDNRVENLELWTKRQPCGQRVKDLIDFCITNYKAEIINHLKLIP